MHHVDGFLCALDWIVDQPIHHVLHDSVFLHTNVELWGCINQLLEAHLFLLLNIKDICVHAYLPILHVHLTHRFIVRPSVTLQCLGYRQHVARIT